MNSLLRWKPIWVQGTALARLALVAGLLLSACSSSEAEPPSAQGEGFSPTSTPEPAEVSLIGDSIPVPPDRDLLRFVQRLWLPGSAPLASAPVLRPEPLQEGEEEAFWVTDLGARRMYRVTATLRLVTPGVLWYVDSGISVSDQSLQTAARAYDEQLSPRLTGVFGSLNVASTPLTILHTPLRGAQAYIGGGDRYPQVVNPYSNQRPIIYISTAGLTVGSRSYLAVLAHELQHLIHQAADPSEETWVNEGLSELAAGLTGYGSSNLGIAQRGGTVSLTLWPDSSAEVFRHYATAHRFLSYLTQQYGGVESLSRLVQEPQDGAAGIDAYLRSLNTGATFRDVFEAWTVANLLGRRGTGRYSYTDAVTPISPSETLTGPGSVEGSVEPFATRYVGLNPREATVTIRFRGQATVPIIPTTPFSGNHCWWSNRGDSIHSRLTRELDLRDVSKATLEFQVWYDIEEAWDYAYVTVSPDNGETWEVLTGQHTVVDDPVGNALGPGFTGASPGWVQERMELTPYVGHLLLLSFEYATDDAVTLDGLCVDDIAVPEIGFFDNAEKGTGWLAEGFVRTTNTLRQEYQVSLVELRQGSEPVVRSVPLGPENRGTLRITGFGRGLEEAVLVISSITPTTSRPAAYSIVLSQSESAAEE